MSFRFISSPRGVFLISIYRLILLLFDTFFLYPACGPYLVVPYGVSILSIPVLCLPVRKFFWFQFTDGFCSFRKPWKFVSPGGGPLWSWSPNLISFCFISLDFSPLYGWIIYPPEVDPCGLPIDFSQPSVYTFYPPRFAEVDPRGPPMAQFDLGLLYLFIFQTPTAIFFIPEVDPCGPL